MYRASGIAAPDPPTRPQLTSRLPMEISLSGRSAIITGASKGIGLAMATQFAASGADVAVVARGREALDAGVAAIRAKAQTKVVGISADVSDAADVKRAYDEAM